MRITLSFKVWNVPVWQTVEFKLFLSFDNVKLLMWNVALLDVLQFVSLKSRIFTFVELPWFNSAEFRLLNCDCLERSPGRSLGGFSASVLRLWLSVYYVTCFKLVSNTCYLNMSCMHFYTAEPLLCAMFKLISYWFREQGLIEGH